MSLWILLGLVTGLGASEPAPRVSPRALPIPPGHRSFVIPISAYQARNLKKGDRLDILVSLDDASAALIQNVGILRIDAPAPGALTTLELVLRPTQALALAAAVKNKAVLSLALRPEFDFKIVELPVLRLRRAMKPPGDLHYGARPKLLRKKKTRAPVRSSLKLREKPF